METPAEKISWRSVLADFVKRPFSAGKAGLGAGISFLMVRLLSICALLLVAFYNGYPTFFSDTGSYLLTAAFWIAYPPFRAPGYSAFTRIASVGHTAWFVVFAQAIIVVYILDLACSWLVGGNRKFRNACLIAIVFALTALTSLPWLSSLLMPDIFAGIVFLSLFLLVFARELHLSHRILLAVILIVSISSHMSLLPIALASVPVFIGLRYMGRQTFSPFSVTSTLAWLLIPMIASGLGSAALNRSMNLGFSVSPSRNAFLLSRLFGNGLAADFLRENCPAHPYIACRYISDLPKTPAQFLFWHPLIKDLTAHPEEMELIVRGTVRSYPVKFLVRGLRDTAYQLVYIGTGEEIRTFNAEFWTREAILRVFPRDYSSFANSRQSRGTLVGLVYALVPVHRFAFWLSLAVCLLCASRFRFERVNFFFYSSGAFLLINAGICATAVGVYDRYQSRVAWLIPFCLTAYIATWVKEWKQSEIMESAAVSEISDALPELES